ncbi:MAG: VWA domain-containing protein [Nanoarchaeota archaeon]|nr:VWA domain-containing protein [Nanoarchaeota archaeon]
MFNKKKAVLFANFEAMERFYDIEFFSKNFLALYANIGILMIFILALSGLTVSFDVDTSLFSYVILIDSSGSMATTDVFPSRFEAAKIEAKNFVDLLPLGVEVGIIGFSGDSVVYQELDNSKLKVKLAIDNVDYGIIQGTNVYNALINSNKLFGNDQLKSVILISDGQLNVGDAPQIIRYINRNNLLVNTIAVGTIEGGTTEFNTISKVDEDFLKALAFNSGGQFFRVTEIDGFGDSFESLIRETNKSVTIDLTTYLLIFGIGSLSLLWVIHSFKFRVLPL